MKKIILISACKTKTDEKGLAKDLYKGQFTEKAYRYATKIKHDAIYFLSPKYGLVKPTDKIEKVDFTFKDLNAQKRKDWYKKVLNQLQEKSVDLENDHFLFLAYKRYWEGLKAVITNYEAPIEHLGLGEQLGWITDKLNKAEE